MSCETFCPSATLQTPDAAPRPRSKLLPTLQARLTLPTKAASLPAALLLLLLLLALVHSPTPLGAQLQQWVKSLPFRAQKQVLEVSHAMFAICSCGAVAGTLRSGMWTPPKQLQQHHAAAVVPAQLSAWINLAFYTYELLGTSMMVEHIYLALHHVLAITFFAGCLQQPQILCFWIALAYALHSLVWVGLFVFDKHVMLLMVMCSVVLFLAIVLVYHSAAAHKAVSRIVPLSAFAIVVVNYMSYCSNRYSGQYCPYKSDPLLYYAEGRTGKAEEMLAAFAALSSVIACVCLALELKTGKVKQA